jgi:hypothetical protein
MPVQTHIAKQTIPRRAEVSQDWAVPDTMRGLESELVGDFAQTDRQPDLQPDMILWNKDWNAPMALVDFKLWQPTVRPSWMWLQVVPRESAAPSERPTVDEFIAWLDSEDFGDDTERIRREAWGPE